VAVCFLWRNSLTIYIGNLSFEVTKEELCQEFALFGKVTSVTIIENDYHKKYGFVVMPDYSQGQSAIVGINGRTLKNRELKLIEALPLSRHEDSGYYHKKRTGPLSRGVRNGCTENTRSQAIVQIPETSRANN